MFSTMTNTVTATITQQVLSAIENKPGITTKEIYRQYGYTPGEQAIVRQRLIVLARKHNILRAKFATGAGRPYAYFPKTPFGRMKMDAFVTQQYGDKPPKRAYNRRATLTPQPARSTTTPSAAPSSTREYHSTPTAALPKGSVVQGLVRIALPDGTHDVPVNQARQIKDELVELFG